MCVRNAKLARACEFCLSLCVFADLWKLKSIKAYTAAAVLRVYCL